MEQTHMNSSITKKIKYSLYALLIIAAPCSVLFVFKYSRHQNRIINDAKKKAFTITQKAGLIINKPFERLKQAVDLLAADLSTGTLSFEQIDNHIEAQSMAFNGFGVIFKSTENNNDKKQIKTVHVNKSKKLKLIQSDRESDYYGPGNIRLSALPSLEGFFLEPFFDTASNTVVIEYVAPFYDANKKPLGVVFANYSREYVKTLVNSAFPNNLGYGEIVTKTGAFIFHPNLEYVGQPITGPEIARKAGNDRLAKDIEKALSEQVPLFQEDTNWISPEKSWNVFQPIPKLPWLAVGVFIIDELIGETPNLDKELILAAISILLLLVLLILIIIRVYLCTPARLWIGSITISIGLLFSIAFLWHKAFIETNIVVDNPVEKNEFSIDRITAQLSENKARIEKAFHYVTVPTGIYLHQLSISTDIISFTGYVWQKYPLNNALTIKQGITFPQASTVILEKMYEFTDDQWQTICWSIRGVLKQDFDLYDYPFDAQKIKIQIWPRAFDDSVILIPDFDSYKIFNPSALPGINNKIKLQNWRIQKSYFNYESQSFLTNFGYTQNDTSIKLQKNQRTLPELSFNMIIYRYLYSSLILSSLPIFIILVLLFIMLLMVRFADFYPIFASIASLFFSSLLAYSSYKSGSTTQQIVFFDYMYFILQSIILGMSLLIVLYYKKIHIKWLTHEYMLIPKLLFWPLTMLGIFATSFIFFF